MRILVQLPVLLVLCASPALAADFYAYEQDNGTLAFSDEVAKVPARYRDQVERRGVLEVEHERRFVGRADLLDRAPDVGGALADLHRAVDLSDIAYMYTIAVTTPSWSRA